MGARERTPVSILDAHQHFWDLQRNYHPWLCDEPPIPFRYGDYRAIRRDYIPADLLRDAGDFHLVGSVYVETEWDPTDGLGETRWIHEIADEHGLPSAVVAQAWLHHDDAAAMLAAQAAFPLVRGVRHKPAVVGRSEAVPSRAPGSMSDPKWRDGFAALAPNGLSFDLQAPWWHLGEAARLAADFPETLIIVNHTGLPADRSEAGLAAWRRALETIAGQPNVALKISGLGKPDASWSVEANRPIVRDAIGIFGVERCMFASNFPVDGLVASYAQIFHGFLEMTEDFTHSDRDRLFVGNAKKFYRIADMAMRQAE